MTHTAAQPTRADDLPTGPGVAYHVAYAERATSILDSGLDPTREREKWAAFNEFLEAVAAREGVAEKPASRAECAFAYTGLRRGTDPTVHLSGYVTVAIDLHTVTAPLYAASYGTATGAYATFSQHSPDDRRTPDPASQAYAEAHDYWNTLQPYDPSTGAGETASELLIDGPVPADALTHVLR